MQPAATASPRPTVLVVDDERGPRESLRMILEPAYQVLTAATGSDALEALRTRPVDLVTLDLNMPGMRGADVMRTVRTEFPEVEIVVITGCGSLESATEGIRYGICDYLQKPFDVVQVGAAVSRALARHRSRGRLTTFLEELGALVGRDRDVHALIDDVQRSHKLRGRLADLFEADQPASSPTTPGRVAVQTIEFLEVLAETIETKDRYMRGHARRVSSYAGLLADRLNLSAAAREQVRVSAFLHDLGKVGVPTELLLREGGLDPQERRTVQEHPSIGARLIRPLDVPSSVVHAIRHHHEWWDGTGYPDGLAGEEIPLTARIVAIADAFDAMTCDRPYRKALERPQVVQELERYGGVQFDPNLTKDFLAILESGAGQVDPELLAEAAASLGFPAEGAA